MRIINYLTYSLVLILSVFIFDTFKVIDNANSVEANPMKIENVRQSTTVTVGCKDSIDLGGIRKARICLKDGAPYCEVRRYNNVLSDGTCTYTSGEEHDADPQVN